MPTGLPTHGFGLLPGFGQHHVNYPQVPGRYYEIGLDVSDEAPHTIRKTVELIGLNRRVLPILPQDGDELVAVNGQDVTQLGSLRTRPDLLKGTEGSVVNLTIKTQAHEILQLAVRRMVPSRLWALYQQACYEIPRFRDALDQTKWAVTSSDAGSKELLGDFGDAETCLGMIVDNPPDPTLAIRVIKVREASPAAMAGVRVGDSVLKVDGVQVHAGNVGLLLKPSRASIGSTCVVLLSRDGKSFEKRLSRSSLARVQMTQRLLDLIGTAKGIASQSAEWEPMMAALQHLREHSMVMAANRVETERNLASKVSNLQKGLADRVSNMRWHLQLFPSAQDVWEDLSSQAALTVQQAADLHEALHTANRLKADLEAAKHAMAGQTIQIGAIKHQFDQTRAVKDKMELEMRDMHATINAMNVENLGGSLNEAKLKIAELQDDINSLEGKIKQLEVENEEFRSLQRTQGSKLQAENTKLKGDLARAQLVERTSQALLDRNKAMDNFCSTPPDLKIVPDDLVQGFRGCEMRADDVVRLLKILSSQPPPVVDQVDHVFQHLHEAGTPFWKLVDTLKQASLLHRRLEHFEEENKNMKYMVEEERRMRVEAQENYAECSHLVEASSGALEEWIPLMEALKRAPAVSSRYIVMY